MSKKRKVKTETPVKAPPPKLSNRDLLRLFPGLFLRALIVIMPLTLLMTVLGANGLTLFNDFWVQMGCYIGAYALFNNFIFGPVKKYRQQLAQAQAVASKAKK
ncbi:MAG: hypothetical protein SFU83_13875 [Meiothermus sp.]|nr:hypothetical protein [Meiothermus sp.]